MKKIFLLVFAIISLSSINAFCQTEKIEAAFIYNFTSLVNWPDSYRSGNFVIVVLGNSSIAKELEESAKVKKAGSQTIVVKNVNSVSEVGNAHIVFVTDGQISKLRDLSNIISSTLIVTESSGATSKGSMINFVQQDNKLRFELNEAMASAKSLKLAPNLVKLGIPVK